MPTKRDYRAVTQARELAEAQLSHRAELIDRVVLQSKAETESALPKKTAIKSELSKD